MLASALGVTPRAVRMRAFRGRWTKTYGTTAVHACAFPDERPAGPQRTRDTTVHSHDSAHARPTFVAQRSIRVRFWGGANERRRSRRANEDIAAVLDGVEGAHALDQGRG